MAVSLRVLVALTAISTACAPAAEPEPTSEEDKTLYALGFAMSRSLAGFGLSESEFQVVKRGLEDGVLDREPLVRPEAYAADIQRLQRARATATAEAEDQLAQAFLEQAAAEPGAARTDSGLVIREVTAGTGEQPARTDTVRVHYHGTLRDGTVFDSSVERGKPAVFPLNRVIPCWTEALKQMRVGGKIKLTCPPDTAYGDRGAPPKIGPGATLTFDVELLEIVEASPPKAGAQ